MHDRPDDSTLPKQQLSPPPGRLPHPVPPQEPQDEWQQIVPVRRPVAQLGSPGVASTLQGGPTSLHDRPEDSTLLTQQSDAPPGRLSHPAPPQEPQDEWQQTAPAGRPVAQLGSPGMARCGVVWLGVARCGVAWHGAMRCGMAWRSVAAWRVRRGVAWRLTCHLKQPRVLEALPAEPQ